MLLFFRDTESEIEIATKTGKALITVPSGVLSRKA